jgi:ubiquinone/menaquinone biosynthesis C-methylase UbiE
MTNHIKNCNICNSTDLIKLKNYEKFYLIKCLKCSFVFSFKIPSFEEVVKCYDRYDRQSLNELSLKNIEKIVIAHIKKYNPKNVLDVGCGNGDFLNFYKKHGINTYFTEYGDDLINKLKKNHTLVEGGMFPVSELKFDLVILSEIIEHTLEPDKIIKCINKIQKKEGVIYLTTPNINCLEAKIYKNNYSIFTYPEHLSYFSSETINLLFKNSNYKRISNYTDNFSVYRFINFLNQKLKKNIDPNKVSNKLQVVASRTFLIFIKKFISYVLRILNLGNGIKAEYTKFKDI